MGIDDEIARGEIGNDSAEVLKLRHERHLDNVDLVHAYAMGRDAERAAVVAWFVSQGMTEDEAQEYFEVNTVGGWFGDGTPVFLMDDTEEIEEKP